MPHCVAARAAADSTGLGLDIAYRMAKAAGGDVRIDRSSLGGAQIQIWLPTVLRPL